VVEKLHCGAVSHKQSVYSSVALPCNGAVHSRGGYKSYESTLVGPHVTHAMFRHSRRDKRSCNQAGTWPEGRTDCVIQRTAAPAVPPALLHACTSNRPPWSIFTSKVSVVSRPGAA